ncbi:MAG: M23 family metallopeptidase [bacterium]
MGSDRRITLWVMKDVYSEPVEYRVRVSRLKAGIIGVCCLFVVLAASLAVSLFWSHYKLTSEQQRSQSLLGEVKKLSCMRSRYHLSQEKVNELSERLAHLEKKTDLTVEKTKQVIGKIDHDIKNWFPRESAGGAGSSDSGIPAATLSPSLLDKVDNLEQRLGRLNNELDLYEKTLKEVHWTWQETNYLFRSMPSMWPVKDAYITSKFGLRVHPVTREVKMHAGIDLAASRGTKIYAPSSGVVSYLGYLKGYGHSLEIDHGYGIGTFYGHCKKILVKRGQKVKLGQEIATVGSSGLSTGPHLHFEVRILGKKVDPLQYLGMYPAGK